MPPAVLGAEVFSPLVEHAIELAAQWHDGIYRKCAWRDAAFEVPSGASVQVPYVAHVTVVAMVVQRAGWNEATVAAAYVHDVIEDMNQHGQRLRRTQLREALGDEVGDIVEGVTEQKYDAHGVVRPWRARKEEYVEQLRSGRPEAMAVSLADKLHNLWTTNQGLSVGDDVFARGPNRRGLNAGPEQQLWLHRAVLDASRQFEDPRLDALRKALEREIERFESLVSTG